MFYETFVSVVCAHVHVCVLSQYVVSGLQFNKKLKIFSLNYPFPKFKKSIIMMQDAFRRYMDNHYKYCISRELFIHFLILVQSFDYRNETFSFWCQPLIQQLFVSSLKRDDSPELRPKTWKRCRFIIFIFVVTSLWQLILICHLAVM